MNERNEQSKKGAAPVAGFRFDRMELAGSLGDLGTLLPLSLGMVVINGLDPLGIFFTVGLFYVFSGLYYRVTVPVQPMKVIGAYAIATGISASQITAAGLLMGLCLLVVGVSGAVNLLGRYIPRPVIRGVQLSTGVLLMSQGVKFMLGISRIQVLRQAAEPYLTVQTLGPLSIGIVIGLLGAFLTFFLIDNRRLPAGLVVVLAGILIGILLGAHEGFSGLRPGLYLPGILPFGFPPWVDFATAFLVLTVPQLPMTMGNAVVANADLSREYFGVSSRRVSYRALCIGMALANFGSFLVGGMPLCHGAGGLAAHYRFGARTGGSNLIIGGFFLLLSLFLGVHIVPVFHLIPMSVLGILLLFAGAELAMTILDLRERRDLFVALLILGITLPSNLAAGFLVGIPIAHALRSGVLKV